MQCNEEKSELNFICHDKNNGMREEINAMDKNIFIILSLKKMRWRVEVRNISPFVP